MKLSDLLHTAGGTQDDPINVREWSSWRGYPLWVTCFFAVLAIAVVGPLVAWSLNWWLVYLGKPAAFAWWHGCLLAACLPVARAWPVLIVGTWIATKFLG